MIRIYKSREVGEQEILARSVSQANVEAVVAEVLERVRTEGDRALLDYEEKWDGVRLNELRVSPEEITKAVAAVDPSFLEILREAAANIRRFHEKQVRTSFLQNDVNGVVTGQKIVPLDRAGLYVPGGTAAYPSTVLMDAIPARIAGCREIVMVTPPDREGRIHPAILAAASVAGVDRIYKIGGAQAIAALAYGTESIPRVDKIVGPGNAFVAEAKKQVYGTVAIDMIAGPSEILIVADAEASPRCVAADLLSQAEHDRLASAVLVTNSEPLAVAVQQELERQLPRLSREAIARESVEKNGKIIVTETLEEAIDISNALAPEHLELCVADPFAYLDRVRHAGSVFLGRYCPEALGDYFAGPNHTLPTSGTARFSSPLSVDDFVKKIQYTYYTADALRRVADKVARFAEEEGLTAHAYSARVRQEESQ